ncbi:MAG TPA: hypothetical protein VFZ67_11270 [Nitrososphaera sp.]
MVQSQRKEGNGEYFKPSRLAAIREIRRKIIEAPGQYSHAQIQRELGLSRQTYLRYFELASQDRTEDLHKLAMNQGDILRQAAILRKRLGQTWAEIRELSNNSQFDPKTRDSMVNAKLASVKLAVMLMKLHDEVAVAYSPSGMVTRSYVSREQEEEEEHSQEQSLTYSTPGLDPGQFFDQELRDGFAMRWVKGVMTRIDISDLQHLYYERGKGY